MAISALSQVHQPYLPRGSDYPEKSADSAGNTLPPRNSGENVNISADGRSALEREMQSMAEARDNLELIDLRGRDGKIRLGIMALGQSTIDEWSSKGLELDEKSIIAAGEAFQRAFRNNLQENASSASGSAIALNRHQIIVNSQAVPDWFIEEYENALSSMDDNELKSAFENGDTFFIFRPSTSSSEALSRYAEVRHNT